jgi:hypothetical protein
MTYLTHKTVSISIIARFKEFWTIKFPRVLYQNLSLIPSPTETETWVEFSIVFGESNLGNFKNINGDNRIDRHHGVIRIKLHVPLGKFIGTTQDLVDVIGKIFGYNWGIPHLFIAGPPRQQPGEKVGTHFVTPIDIPFYFDKQAGQLDVGSLSSDVAAMLSGSSLL